MWGVFVYAVVTFFFWEFGELEAKRERVVGGWFLVVGWRASGSGYCAEARAGWTVAGKWLEAEENELGVRCYSGAPAFHRSKRRFLRS